MDALFLLILLSIFSCSTPQPKNSSHNTNQFSDTEECSNLYPFDGYYINLDDNNALLIDGIPSTDFKTCSKYAHRFVNVVSDSVILNGKTWVVDQNKEKGKYNIAIFENNKKVQVIQLPVENPLPEVHEYYIHLFTYKNDVIMLMEDMYTTHFLLCKYNSDGKELMRTEIEHTFVTHPEPNTDYHHKYLYFKDITSSHMIFTSHYGFSEKHKTVVLSMDDFSTIEYANTVTGLILDENDAQLSGFINQSDDTFRVEMTDGSKYRFEIEYGNPGCNCILKDNLLYIANYHPIATGSSLHCFNLSTGKMKWTADVKQLMVGHSEYYNTVTISMYKNKIIMEGNEASGDYVQIFDAETGKRLAEFGDFPKE